MNDIKESYQTPPQCHQGQSLWPWSSGRSFCRSGRPYRSQVHTPSEPQWHSQHYAPVWQTIHLLGVHTDAYVLCIHFIYFVKSIIDRYLLLRLSNCVHLVYYLPHTDNGIGNENKQNDKRLNKGSHSLFTLLKPGQYLKKHTNTDIRDQHKIHIHTFYSR